MSKRVVVQVQMKTIKRYSFPGFLSLLFLAVLVALPIVECFLPINALINTSIDGSATYSFTMIDVVKSVFKLDNGTLMTMFTHADPVPYTEQALNFYNTFIGAMPIINIVAMAIFFLQGVIAIIAFILILIFLFRGRWSHFSSPSILSHFGLWFSFFMLVYGNGSIIFATAMNLGGYKAVTNGYLVFGFPGWLYSLIYFGAGLAAFLGIFFAHEYGFADRIYVGKNRRPDEPDITFFDKNDYAVEDTAIGEVSEPNDGTNDNGANPEESKDVVVGTTIKPVEPQVVPEPAKGIPQNIEAIGNRQFAENQNVINANIPEHIEKIGDSAFSNCLNLKSVYIPKQVKSIGSNCFFNCARLKKITYAGTKVEWKLIKRGSNWLIKAGTKIVNCSDGPVQVNPIH